MIYKLDYCWKIWYKISMLVHKTEWFTVTHSWTNIICVGSLALSLIYKKLFIERERMTQLKHLYLKVIDVYWLRLHICIWIIWWLCHFLSWMCFGRLSLFPIDINLFKMSKWHCPHIFIWVKWYLCHSLPWTEKICVCSRSISPIDINSFK